MSRAGITRAEAITVTTALSTDKVLLQRLNSSFPLVGQYSPYEITVANLFAGGADTPTLNLGGGGVAGQLNIFPAAANAGNLRITDSSTNSGGFLTTVTLGSQAEANTYTIPDAGANANFLMSAGAQTGAGAMTWSGVNLFTGGVNITTAALSVTSAAAFTGGTSIGSTASAGVLTLFPGTANGTTTLTMSANTGNTITNINVAAQAAARTYTIADAGVNTSFMMLGGAQTVTGTITYSNKLLVAAGSAFAIVAAVNGKQNAATLVAGTVTVANTSVTANSKVYVTRTNINGSTAVGQLVIGTIVAGTSFVINSVQPATPASIQTGDTSIIEWLIVEAA